MRANSLDSVSTDLDDVCGKPLGWRCIYLYIIKAGNGQIIISIYY